MGFEYALVHVKYTIPPAILLTQLYRPLFSKLDAYKIVFLITIAVVSTIPWDSYLIRTRIWSYPSHVIIGPKLFDIPIEEVFFFIIQTYNTSLFYLILSKPTFQPIYLRVERHGSDRLWPWYKLIGQWSFISIIALGWSLVKGGVEGTYTGLILIWAVPFLLLLWSLAYQFILGLPLSNTLVPIAIPTLYLWIIDTLALKRGTWVINTGTKVGLHLWDGLEIEEALFFLVTNTLIIFGQIAFDHALSILYTFPDLFPDAPLLPSPLLLIRALLTAVYRWDEDRINGLKEAVTRLKKKSRSFYFASSTFQGQLRTDLLLLYSFCRVADDLVDDAATASEASAWIAKLHRYLELIYSRDEKTDTRISDYVVQNFPPGTQYALLQLPYLKISRQPLEDLLHGFETDLEFTPTSHPINTESDLQTYAHRVAGTVARMCIECIFYDYQCTSTTPSFERDQKQRIIDAGDVAGIALQYVNIARDIAVDAKMGRVYIPTTWLTAEGLSHDSILKDPHGVHVESLRTKLLDKAFALYDQASEAIEELPVEARGPIRVAVESYMEIGRVLRQEGYVVKAGRATVPKIRRLRVAWKALKGRLQK
ncbi:Lycopene beta-cyclase [Aaosphaeria arxii CBS 175.79]|uniref:Bifunctional lycopene cyclase/phytoene synthase n=1 Tax=Aaosphaeria arxii CBS 175.79 TaxID=1450172 RepID=A0A6A5XD49_9PLEO|nr:Lycopene beta-cyclase [Aaosphaeria arxii CBS 175.79]KAF2010736.1 Lycopene beta-cyclase [Aaosphaeria arxii CBS 175.79]